VLMIIGGLFEAFLGVNAERRSLEEVAPPLSARSSPTRGSGPDVQVATA
jgi:hypothetical protein